VRRIGLIGIQVALFMTGCAGQEVRDCSLPPLPEAEVARIGREYLDSKGIIPSFREHAEVRVTPVGCHYEYEEAEKLDSFGVGFVVEIDRNGALRDFYSSE